MNRWKSRGWKSQRGEEQKREDQKRERMRRKKMQVREKVGKLLNTMFFQWFLAPEGRKVCSLKRRVRSRLAKWEMKSCTPRVFCTCWLGNVFLATTACTFSTAELPKVLRTCDFFSIFTCKCASRHNILGPRLEVEMSKKWTLLWHEAHFEVKSIKNCWVRALLDVQMSFCVAGTKDSASLSKVSKACGFRGNFNYKQHSTTLHSATSTTPTAITHITLH